MVDGFPENVQSRPTQIASFSYGLEVNVQGYFTYFHG